MTKNPVVLVVDDEPHIVRVVTLKLSRAKLTVLTAHDGLSALDILRTQRVDLVITDHQMPDMTGLDLARRTSADQTPVIMLTARDFALSEENLSGTNIVCVMNKPFSPSELLSRVESTLGIAPTESTDR